MPDMCPQCVFRRLQSRSNFILVFFALSVQYPAHFMLSYVTYVIMRYTLREEHRLRLFGPKRGELTGECRKLHNEELHNLYSSPDVIRQSQVKPNEVSGACGTHGRGEKSVQSFGGKARRKDTTGKTKA
jgi:hypothetical protein